MAIDLLISGGTVLPLDDNELSDGAVVVDDGQIQAVGPAEELEAEYSADEYIDATDHVVLPGLITTHVHVSDILMRGLADNRFLFDWLFNSFYPGQMAMEPDEHALAAALYCREAISGGVTTFVENALGDAIGYSDDVPTEKLDVYEQTGMRAIYGHGFHDVERDDASRDFVEQYTLGDPEVEHTSPLAVTTDEALDNVESLIETHHGRGDGRLSIWPAPISVRNVTPEGLRGAYAVAKQYDVMTTTHAAEYRPGTQGDLTSIEYLEDVDYLGPRTLLGHCVHITEADIRRLAATDTRVAHNVVTNLKLATGIAPLPTLQSAGVTVGLGTDNTSANDTVDPLSDLRFAALLHRGHREDPTAVTAGQALKMVTVDAARAIGRPELGVLAPDTPADLILVDVDQPHMQPSPNIPRTLVHRASRSDVVTTICNGEIIYQDSEVPGVDDEYPDLTDTVSQTARSVHERAGLTMLE